MRTILCIFHRYLSGILIITEGCGFETWKAVGNLRADIIMQGPKTAGSYKKFFICINYFYSRPSLSRKLSGKQSIS